MNTLRLFFFFKFRFIFSLLIILFSVIIIQPSWHFFLIASCHHLIEENNTLMKQLHKLLIP